MIQHYVNKTKTILVSVLVVLTDAITCVKNVRKRLRWHLQNKWKAEGKFWLDRVKASMNCGHIKNYIFILRFSEKQETFFPKAHRRNPKVDTDLPVASHQILLIIHKTNTFSVWTYRSFWKAAGRGRHCLSVLTHLYIQVYQAILCALFYELYFYFDSKNGFYITFFSCSTKLLKLFQLY